MDKIKNIIKYVIILGLIPVFVIGGMHVFEERQFSFLIAAVALLSVIPFFLSFERSKSDERHVVILAVMVALASASRAIFVFLPAFKPVTAIVVLTAIYFGPMSGFICGSMSALVSNFFFSQGLWTPMQMFTWGIIGLIAGLICDPLKKSKPLLIIYGILTGVLFSLVMDVFTASFFAEGFSFEAYLLAVTASFPTMATYAASNVLFLIFLSTQLEPLFKRIKTKYGLKSN